ncbi:MAG: hypothetical protein WCX84_06450 [Syntrophales bacterium]|jgi:hypothetical protein
MSNVMTLAIQITAVDMLRSVVERVKDRVLSLGSSAGKVKRDFDDMTTSITRGLKSIAVASYALKKALPGIKTAANMQEAMLKVKANLVSSVRDAAELDRAMKSVKSSAIAISANAPFTAEQVVDIEAALLKAGVAMENVIGEKGAAWAAAGGDYRRGGQHPAPTPGLPGIRPDDGRRRAAHDHQQDPEPQLCNRQGERLCPIKSSCKSPAGGSNISRATASRRIFTRPTTPFTWSCPIPA